MNNSSTRLIYLWIDNYKLFHNAEFYFTHDYIIKKEKLSENKLNIEAEKVEAYPNMISLVYPDTPITNYNIIVGENGSGKTTLAKILNLVSLGNETLKYCLIFESNNSKLSILSSLKIESSSIQHIHSKYDNFPFIVYYSPCYTSTHDLVNHSLYNDISTTRLLIKDASSREDKPEGSDTIRVNHFLGHRLQDIRRICQLLNFLGTQSYKETEALWESFCIPSTLNIFPEDLRTLSKDPELWVAELDLPMEERLRQTPEHTQAKLLINILENRFSKSSAKSFFLDYMAVNLYNNLIYMYKNTAKIDFYDIGNYSAVSLFDYIYEYITQLKIPSFDGISTAPYNNAHIEFMQFMQELPDSFFHKNNFETCINLSFKKDFNYILKFIALYQKCSFIDFMHIEMEPILSSGEYNLLVLFARLYELKDKIENQYTLIILDEVESTLHYSLQLKTINLIIQFIDIAFKNAGKGIQLIFSSHSPLLLSDFAKGSIIKLQTSNEIQNGRLYADTKQVQVINEKNNSLFGANLYQLCNDGFLINESLIGNFSKAILTKIIKEELNLPLEQLNKLINSFADPVLQLLIRNTLNANKKDDK